MVSQWRTVGCPQYRAPSPALLRQVWCTGSRAVTSRTSKHSATLQLLPPHKPCAPPAPSTATCNHELDSSHQKFSRPWVSCFVHGRHRQARVDEIRRKGGRRESCERLLNEHRTGPAHCMNSLASGLSNGLLLQVEIETLHLREPRVLLTNRPTNTTPFQHHQLATAPTAPSVAAAELGSEEQVF